MQIDDVGKKRKNKSQIKKYLIAKDKFKKLQKKFQLIVWT